MGKRSPILGYNHNVRYRGLVFHVQTEDSGVSTPHLFTHMFHSGVIVSTRKLVYDAGSAEESIKSLMQAQHKAVLKDLRRGHFDDKIDSYLGGTPGLLPRGTEDTGDRPGEVELVPSAGTVEDLAGGGATEQVSPMLFDESAPVPAVEAAPPLAVGRAQTRPVGPPPIPSRAATTERSIPAARSIPATIDTTLKTEAPSFDSAPEIEIQLELNDDDEAVPIARRTTRDTETQMPIVDPTRSGDDLVKAGLGLLSEEARRSATISDGVPGSVRASSPVIPPAGDSRRLGDRPSTINAATLPPARPIPRPAARPAVSQPQVVSRPVTSDDRSRRESEAVEVYSPALPSAELPPGERLGQYAQHKKVSTRIPIDGLKNAPGVPIPAGLGRPQRAATAPKPNAPNAPNGSLPPAGSAPTAVPRDVMPRASGHTEPLRARVPTPARISPGNPAVSRTSTGGVVMSRPAVIVGGPAKTTGTIPRIRKAREDEGRGFGQGLISEKSLDEVILAYLSEDADDK